MEGTVVNDKCGYGHKKLNKKKKAVLIDIFSVTEHEFQVHSFHV